MLQAVRLLRRELDGKTPLIGFSGAPFTIGSYLIEGGKSRHFELTKRMLYGEPETWHALASKLSEVIKRYLLAQIQAGAHAVQLFDSWVGELSPTDYREFVPCRAKSILSRSSRRASRCCTSAPAPPRCSR